MAPEAQLPASGCHKQHEESEKQQEPARRSAGGPQQRQPPPPPPARHAEPRMPLPWLLLWLFVAAAVPVMVALLGVLARYLQVSAVSALEIAVRSRDCCVLCPLCPHSGRCRC